VSTAASVPERRVSWPHNWTPRPQHAEIFAAEAAGMRRFALVVHRRWGKSSVAWQLVIKRALTMPGTLHLFVGPTHQQVTSILWTGRDHLGQRLLDYLPAECVAHSLENERELRLHNGSTIRLMSGENPDRLRGLNALSVIFDEWSVFPDAECWDVVAPMLSENAGLAAFLYTPAGEGHGLALWRSAVTNPAEWYARRYTIDETRRDGPGENGEPIFTDSDVARMRADGVPESAIRRDLFCSFEAPTEGAIYAVEIERLLTEGRIAAVPWQAHLEVESAWDLGARANNAVVVFQRLPGGAVHVIEALRSGEEGLPGLVREVLRRPYLYRMHHVPHDAEQTERSSELSLKVQLQRQGLRPLAVLPPLAVEAGIYAAKMLLSRIYIDAVKAASLVDSLRAYRQDGLGKPIKDGVHDHMADAFRYAATAKAPASWEALERARMRSPRYARSSLSGFSDFSGRRGPWER
jgi:hypothetical protein